MALLSSKKMCRICESSAETLENITTEQNLMLTVKYTTCANVTFDKFDKLPKYFCELCIAKLNAAFDFKLQCEIAEQKFYKIINNLDPAYTLIKEEPKDFSPIEDAYMSIKEEPKDFSSIDNDDGQIASEDKQHSVIDNFKNEPSVDIEDTVSNEFMNQTVEEHYPSSSFSFKHSTGTLFSCDICGQNFKNSTKVKAQLKNHMMIHTETDTANGTNEVISSLLPNKSRDKYFTIYNKFVKWKETEGVDIANNSETVMLAYFNYLSKKYKASTLWAFYSMLKTTIILNQNVEIKYPKLISFLKKQSVGFVSRKFESFEPKHINRFLWEAPDNEFLDCKIALIFGIYGATRADELTNVALSDVKIHGEVIVVKIGKRKSNVIRTITIENDYAAYVWKYINYRPSKTHNERFFLNFRNGKCTTQPIGRNKFLEMPKKIAKFLKLPNAENFSGHSFRCTAAALAADEGDDRRADIRTLKRHGSKFSNVAAEEYVQDLHSSKRKIIGPIISSTSTITKSEFNNVPETHFEESSSLEFYNETIDANLTDFGRNETEFQE